MTKLLANLLFNLVALFLFTTVAFASSTPKPSILIVGDSLSAAYNMPQAAGWVGLLKQRLSENQLAFRVINASISGDTTASGANRITRALNKAQPALTIIQLGGNDGLRGLSLSEMKKNLDRMIDIAKSHQSKVILVGVNLPPNYGRKYTQDFFATYQQLADKHHVALVPTLLEGFEEDPTFFQADQIHPTIEAQDDILDNVWPSIETALQLN